jgi:hypothetical protein
MMITKVNLLPGAAIDNALNGSPPRVQDGQSELFQSFHYGLFVSALEVVGRIKISNFASHHQLLSELQKYCNYSRILYLTDAEPEVGFVAEVSLPKGNLDLTLTGFPPFIAAISPSSPIVGMVQVGDQVESVKILDFDIDLNLSSGGFTNHRVVKVLEEHKSVERRILVVTRGAHARPSYSRDTSPIWDSGAFRDTTRWSLQRILSDQPSKQLEEERCRSNDYAPISSYPT